MANRSEERPGAGTAMAHVPSTLVLGIGNPLRGDDGVGVHVARRLLERCLRDDVEVVDGGTRGLGLVSLLEGRQRVIVVDAADMGRTPGEFVRFALEEARLPGEDVGSFSVHAAGLREALLLAQALDLLPEEVILFAVQPARLTWKAGLSPQVDAALLALTEAVLREVGHSDQRLAGSERAHTTRAQPNYCPFP
jgi:hydrogenase maturation protease